MGIVELLANTLQQQLASKGLAVVIASAFVSFIVLAIVLNVLSQLLFKNPKEPPIVFHWVPFFGSTVVYGIDPYKFFFACREKVSGISWNEADNRAACFASGALDANLFGLIVW
jgi:sterol 14alpha-demethylase